MDYVELLAAHDRLAERNEALERQVEACKKASKAILVQEIERTKMVLDLRDQVGDLLGALLDARKMLAAACGENSVALLEIDKAIKAAEEA